MTSARIVLKLNTNFPKKFLIRESLYIGLKIDEVEALDKNAILEVIRNKLINSMATILTPTDPLNFDKRDILDIRITTAANGNGENAIRRLKSSF